MQLVALMRNAVAYTFTGVVIGLVAPIGLVVYSEMAGQVPDLMLVFAIMAGGGTLALGAAGWKIGRGEDLLEARNQELREVSERFEMLSVTDGLTGIPNRRAFDQRLEIELALSDRYHGPLSLVMVDLDLFKRLNDRYGHLAGDEVLRRVTAILEGNKRVGDLVARYGGEELAVILPHTKAEDAAIWAERARRAIAAATMGEPSQDIRITASFGVAEAIAGDESARRLIEAADGALYDAKQAGRDRVVVHASNVSCRAVACK